MSSQASDITFTGSIPKIYETYLVPLIFESYADEMARRVALRSPSRVLEVAAGTGVVTRALASALPPSVSIVATDLNQAMLEHAESLGTSCPVEWRQADAAALPFPAETFDAVICQFGVMFFPDKAKAFGEAHRVLRTGGIFVFNVWDRIEENQFVDTVTTALESIFPQDPPRFHARIPHGYCSRSTIEQDLAASGFTAEPEFETVAKQSEARSPQVVAMAYCQGTPLRSEIEERDALLLDDATVVAANAIEKRFGTGRVSGKIRALIVTVLK